MERSNEKALQILNEQYKSFIDLQDNWSFFSGLAEYVKTAESLAPSKALIKAMEKQRELATSVLDRLNTKSFQELTQSAQKMAEIAQKLTIQYEPAIKAITEMQDHLAGKILSSNPLAGLDNSIFEVAKTLRQSGFAEAIQQFENNQKRIQNVFGNYTFSPTLELVEEETKKIERKK